MKTTTHWTETGEARTPAARVWYAVLDDASVDAEQNATRIASNMAGAAASLIVAAGEELAGQMAAAGSPMAAVIAATITRLTDGRPIGKFFAE